MSKPRWTEAQGLEVVQQWRRSGQSMSTFARAHGMNVQRLSYWRERVGSGAVGEKRRSAARVADKKSKFVPAVIVRAGVALSVHLCRGVIVEAESTRAIEPEWLAELQRALERAS